MIDLPIPSSPTTCPAAATLRHSHENEAAGAECDVFNRRCAHFLLCFAQEYRFEVLMEIDHRQAGVGAATVEIEAAAPSHVHEADGGFLTHASGINPCNSPDPALDWENLFTITVDEHIGSFDLLADFEVEPDSNGAPRSTILDDGAHTYIADLTSHDSNAVAGDDVIDAFARDYGNQSISSPQSWNSLWENDTAVTYTGGPGNLDSNTTGFITPFNDLTLPDLNDFADSSGELQNCRPQRGVPEIAPQSSCNFINS